MYICQTRLAFHAAAAAAAAATTAAAATSAIVVVIIVVVHRGRGNLFTCVSVAEHVLLLVQQYTGGHNGTRNIAS